MFRWKRFGGIASTRPIERACSGWRSAAKRNNERIAVRRALRVRAPLPRSASRWSRKAPISGASRSPTSSSLGCLPVRFAAKPNSNRSVSR